MNIVSFPGYYTNYTMLMGEVIWRKLKIAPDLRISVRM